MFEWKRKMCYRRSLSIYVLDVLDVLVVNIVLDVLVVNIVLDVLFVDLVLDVPYVSVSL